MMTDAETILNSLDPRELGKRLRLARERRGMTQDDAANIIEVARTTMVAIEKGDRRIRPDELVQLVYAYGRDLSEFVRESSLDVLFTGPQYRGPEEYEEEGDEQIEQWVETLKELSYDYYECEQILHSPLVRKYPPEYEINDNIEPSDIAEGLALEERQRLGLGDGPISMLRDLFEQEVGLRIYYLPIAPPKYSEIYEYSDEIGGCIALNSQHPEERNRFSLSHAYCHFLTYRYKPDFYIDGLYPRRSLSERVADAFPPYFLIPTSGITRRFNDIKKSKGKVTPYDLVALAHYYGVSFAALLVRLEGLGLVPSGMRQYLKEQGFKVREVQRELGLDDVPGNRQKLPLRHRLLAAQALNEGLIGESRFAQLLEVDRLDARRVFEMLNSGGNTT